MNKLKSLILIHSLLLMASCQDKGSSDSGDVYSVSGGLEFEEIDTEYIGREASIKPSKKSDGVCSAEDLPAGLSINSETCEISGIPTESFFGTVYVELKSGSKTFASIFTLNVDSPSLFYKGIESVPLSSCVPLTLSISKDDYSDDQISLSQPLSVNVSEENSSAEHFYLNSNCSGSSSSSLTFQPGVSEATIYFKTSSQVPDTGNYSFVFSPKGAFGMDDLLQVVLSE